VSPLIDTVPVKQQFKKKKKGHNPKTTNPKMSQRWKQKREKSDQYKLEKGKQSMGVVKCRDKPRACALIVKALRGKKG